MTVTVTVPVPVTAERLRDALDYDPDTGWFTWRATRGRAKAGARAGRLNANGYWEIGVDGRLHQAHRLAWLYVHGAWPADQIDHVNGVRDDNRIANLREATAAQNLQNLPMRRTNTSGFIGASWSRRTGRWLAQIKVGGKARNLGLYDTAQAAHEAYVAAKAELHTFQPTIRQGAPA
jgi:hypothetical protein